MNVKSEQMKRAGKMKYAQVLISVLFLCIDLLMRYCAHNSEWATMASSCVKCAGRHGLREQFYMHRDAINYFNQLHALLAIRGFRPHEWPHAFQNTEIKSKYACSMSIIHVNLRCSFHRQWSTKHIQDKQHFSLKWWTNNKRNLPPASLCEAYGHGHY